MEKMVSFMPWPLHPAEKAPGTHWIGSWVGPRAGLDVMTKKSSPLPGTKP